jgi:hypothetical protein
VRENMKNKWQQYLLFTHSSLSSEVNTVYSLLKELETTAIYQVTFHFVYNGFTSIKGFNKLCIYIISNAEFTALTPKLV